MDPEQNNIPETIPTNTPATPEIVTPEPVSQEGLLTSESLQHISTPIVSETTPIQVLVTEETLETTPTFDPKILATNLEDSWSDEKVESAQLFHQPLTTDKPIEELQAPVQVVEKIVYEKQRVHGFFRTLTLITLLFTGVLMLLEGLNIFSLSIADVSINVFYPTFVILSVIVIWSYKGIFGKIFGLLMFLSVVAGFFVLSVYSSLTPSTLNSTGSVSAVPLVADHPYSKIYLSSLVNILDLNSITGSQLLTSQYDAQRPLSIVSGKVQSGHDYIILSESDKINLLERLYTHLNIGLNDTQAIYLYNKTLLGQNNLDLTNIDIRGLRLHGAVVSRNIILGSGSATPVVSKIISLSGIVSSGTIGSGAELGSGIVKTGTVLSGVLASKIEVKKSSIIDLDLQAAVADVTLHLPKDMGVRIHYKSYIGKMDFPGLTETEKNTYESANIDNATSVVDINAVFGLSRFTILQDR